MLALLLCLSPPLQGPGHAALHAPDSELYFEVPAIGESVAAVASSPIARAVTSREFREAVAPFVDIDDANPVRLLESLLYETGLDGDTRDAITQCFVGLTAVSVSVRGAQAGAVEALHEKRRVLETLEDLRSLDKLLGGGWGRDLPSDLTGLDGVTDELFVDGWGRDYIYEPGQGRHYKLLSYGSDGEEGGGFGASDLSPNSNFELAQVRVGIEGLGMLMVLEFDEAALAEQTAYLATEGLAMANVATEERPFPGDETGGTYTVYREDGFPELSAWFFSRGERFIYGLGAESIELVSARLNSEGNGLESVADFQKTLGRVGGSKGQLLYRGYSTLDPFGYLFGLVGRVAPIDEDNPFSSFDFLMEMYSMRQPSAWRTVFDGEQYVTESFCSDADLSFLGLPQVEPRELKASAGIPVPDDAVFVFATTVNGEALAEGFRAGLAAALGDAGDVVLETGIAILGFDPTEDLLGNMTGDLLIYSRPMRGFTAPPMSILVGLDDEETFRDGLLMLAELVENKLPNVVRAREHTYRDVEMLSFQLGDPNSDAAVFNPFDPCIAVVEGKLLVTLSSLHAKREIKRLQRLDSEEPVHPLFLDPDGLGPGVISTWYVDWAALLEGLDSTARAIGATVTAFAPRGEFPDIDWSRIPDIRLITSHIEPSRGNVRRVSGGLLTREVNSIGPETWFGGPALGFSTFKRFEAQKKSNTWHQATRVVVMEMEPKDEYEAYTLDALRQIVDALDRFHAERGRFPDDLETLLDGSKRNPNGYLEDDQFLNDAWGMPLIYTTTPNGRDFELRSGGPDSVDAGGRKDDIKAR